MGSTSHLQTIILQTIRVLASTINLYIKFWRRCRGRSRGKGRKIQPVKREKKPIEVLTRVARVLKLVDEEDDLEAGKPVEVALVPVPKALTLGEESEVEVIEALLARKRTLKKVADAAAPEVVPTVAVNMVNFIANRKKQAPPPSVPPIANVEAFLANEPVEAIPVNVAEPVVEEPIQAPSGLIPSVLCHPLGSNIQHILEDIEMDLEESVGMGNNHMGPFNAAVEKTPRRLLSLTPKAGASSRAPTPKRPRSLILDEADRAWRSKRPRAFEASESESSTEIQPEGANWTVGGKLAELGGDLKGNPFKAIMDLTDHDKL